MTPTQLQWARVAKDAFTVALFAYIAGMLAYWACLAFAKNWMGRLATGIAWFGVLGALTAIVGRGIADARIPWGNMYEFSLALSFLVVLAYLALVERQLGSKTMGGFVLFFAVITMAIGASFFYVGPGALVPSLNSYWRQIHVTAMITASSLLGVGCIISIAFLFKDASERRQLAKIPSMPRPPIMGASIDVGSPPASRADDDAAPHDLIADGDGAVAERAVARGRFPSAATLDKMAYRMISFGFPVWTFGVICGAIWAQQAWGRYWGWDPKETWSFITWTIFAGYLHARATAGWKGSRAAVVALVGFVSLFVTYYAVNLWIAGLHSYAK
jgi:cytochrome c-type biogenesis protein CcsB